MVGSIIVVGALTPCALLHSMCDLKAAQMNVLRMHLGFERLKQPKIFAVKMGKTQLITVTRWFKFFHSCCNQKKVRLT